MEGMNEKKKDYSRPAQVGRNFGDGMKLCMTAIIKSCAVGKDEAFLYDTGGTEMRLKLDEKTKPMFRNWWKHIYLSQSNALSCFQVKSLDGQPIEVLAILENW